MQIGLVGQPYDRFFPPAQNSIGLIVKHTAVQLSRGHEITVYGKRFRDDEIPDDLPFKLKLYSVPFDQTLQKSVRMFPRVTRALRIERMYEKHFEYRRKVCGGLASDRPQIIHIMNFWDWCRDFKRAWSRGVVVLEMQCEWLSQRDRQQVAHQLEIVDAVVAVSDHIASTFRAAFPNFPGAVITVGNGVDIDLFSPQTKPETPSASPRNIILFVGRVSPEKGIHTLIEAFAEVVNEVPDSELRIVGPQWPLTADFLFSLSSDPRVAALLRFYDRLGRCTYSSHLESLLKTHGLQDRVQFVGNVSHENLVQAYRDADVVVNPSLSESFGISVVEAMACSRPVVGTRVGGMCESILDGATGILVEPDHPKQLSAALISVLKDSVRARLMGMEGRRRAIELYSWRARAARLESLYERLLINRRAPRTEAEPSRDELSVSEESSRQAIQS